MSRTYSAGVVTAYGSALAGGYTGTYEEFCNALGDLANVLTEFESFSVTVSTLPAGSSATASYSEGVLSLGIPKGDKGDKGNTGDTGATGNGISNIVKTGTSGLVDTYTVNYTNGGTATFTVTNGEKGDKGDTGNGIASIAKTSTSGNVDTYTVTYTDGNTTTFTVTNGSVTSVNGSTGDVQLDADDIAYDSNNSVKDVLDNKVNKVSPSVSGDVLITDGNGEVVDSGITLDMILNNGFSWDAIDKMVKSGAFKDVFSVGNQITDKWKESATGTEYDVPWNVVHIDENDDVYLQWDYATPTAMPFDEPEALYVFDGTEGAGTFYIEIKVGYGTGWVSGDGIQFTLTSAPSEGDQLVINTNKDNATNPTNVAFNVYAKGSTVSKQSGTTSNGKSGTKLGETATTAGHQNGRVNSIQRVIYGYNRWSQSAVRQYLNSDQTSWWEPQNDWDRPVSQASTMRGFLCGFDQEFLDILESVDVTTVLNTVEGLADTYETTQDKIFLPSLEEMYITPQLADVEGTEWDYYKELADEAGLSGKFAEYSTYSELISYNISSHDSPVGVRLRSADRGGASGVWYVGSAGSVSYSGAYYAFRSRPACKLKKSV